MRGHPRLQPVSRLHPNVAPQRAGRVAVQLAARRWASRPYSAVRPRTASPPRGKRPHTNAQRGPRYLEAVPQMNSAPAEQAGERNPERYQSERNGAAAPAFKQEGGEGDKERILRRGWHLNPAGQHPAGGLGDGGTCHHQGSSRPPGASVRRRRSARHQESEEVVRHVRPVEKIGTWTIVCKGSGGYVTRSHSKT